MFGLSSYRNYIARLNADGSLDTTFLNGKSGASGNVNSLALQSDGKVVIGGAFVYVNGVRRNYIARLNTDGSLDTSFQDGMSGANDTVYSLAIQSDGKVLIGGAFGGVNGLPSTGIARLWGDAMATNRAPIAVADARMTVVNVPISLPVWGLLSNDSDPDGDALSLLSVPTNTTQNGLLTLVGDAVRYTPPVNFVGLDSFVYAITDGVGGTNSATVMIQVDSVCRIAPVTGGIGLSLYGSPGTVLWVQRSTDLRAWTTISTNAIPAGGTEIYTDHGLPLNRAFYRILTQ